MFCIFWGMPRILFYEGLGYQDDTITLIDVVELYFHDCFIRILSSISYCVDFHFRRKVVLVKQNYRCAGCGAKVEPGYMKRYRYCEYLGKYFCPRCHTNAVAYIPGRILRKWDFTKYNVSKFAWDLLSKIYDDPLFNVQDINSSLYRKVRTLDMVRECRIQLSQLRLFLQTCRLGQE